MRKRSSLAGVASAGVSTSVPMSGSGRAALPMKVARLRRAKCRRGAIVVIAAPLFQTMGIPLLKGRYFDDRDVRDAPQVAIIDETMERKFWADQDPIGKRISFQRDPQGNPIWREVVGVVGHVKQKGLDGESPVQYYLPHRQFSNSGVFLVARTTADPSSLASAVRGSIQEVDRELPVFRVTTMGTDGGRFRAQRRFAMALLGIFAVVALILASVGCRVMSYSADASNNDIGDTTWRWRASEDRTRDGGRQGMNSLAGVGYGLVGAFALTRVMRNCFVSVSATDPLITYWWRCCWRVCRWSPATFAPEEPQKSTR